MKVNEVLLENKNNAFIKQHIQWLADQLDIKKLPKITLLNDPVDTTFGQYDPNTKSIKLVTGGRHPVDVLRTLAHELTHYKQDIENNLPDGAGETGTDQENEANANAGIVMRDFAQENPDQFGLDKGALAEGDIAEVNDEWFKTGSFIAAKIANKIEPFRILKEPEVIHSLEGDLPGNVGDYVITGPAGEEYLNSPETFRKLKTDNGDGTASPKAIPKQVKLADHDGVLHTSWGDLQYTKGNDYIVRHGAGDYGAVKKDIFAQTYDNLGQGVAEHIVKHGSQFRLLSKKGKNLGTFPSHKAAAKHEGEVEYFKAHPKK